MPNESENESAGQNPPQSDTPKNIRGLWERCQHFLMSVICVLVFPLMPILLEFWRSGRVETAELMLTAAMYAIGVGLSSNSRLMFVITIFMGMMFAFAYGSTKGQRSSLPLSDVIGSFGIVMVFIIHALERYNIHIVSNKPWDFPGDEDRKVQ